MGELGEEQQHGSVLEGSKASIRLTGQRRIFNETDAW